MTGTIVLLAYPSAFLLGILIGLVRVLMRAKGQADCAKG